MGVFDSIKHTAESLETKMDRLGVSITTAINPNHRHNSPAEKEMDAVRTAICENHRFKSFANVREHNHVKWHVDGHDYFWALSEILDSAKESIFILDWWLTPELYLRRPSSMYEDWRLDRLLLRKAEQGVKIFIVVYKEITQTMTMSSSHTKHYLEDLHPNIAVMRHPDHLGGEITLYWSHHEKLVSVDNTYACIGGLDICFGRWDTHSHPMADAHPTDFNATLFPGQDFNNARIQDFQHVDKWASNEQSRLISGRMPWHDVHLTMVGPSVLDVSMHFIERWNFVKTLKYKNDTRYDWLAFPQPPPVDAEEHDAVARHPHTDAWHRIGRRFKHPFHPQRDYLLPHGPKPFGNMTVQVCRSSADWSMGILTEHSIQNAYVQLIREANHFIFIENQFFITNTSKGHTVKNQIGAALVERIVQAAKDGRKFKVVVVIPCIPCFAGELTDAAGIRAIMAYQYNSICRGGYSIFEEVQKAGVDPHEYISFYNLRSYDRINYDSAMVKQMEADSGISFHQAQIAQARLWLGDYSYESQKTVKIFDPNAQDYSPDDPEKKKKGYEEVHMPDTEEEARDIIDRFQRAAPRRDDQVPDSIARDAMLDGPRAGQETWLGSEKDLLGNYVSEELYIHSKLMIVDDRRIVCGSANLNDRSQNGDRDSEIVLVVEDQEMIVSKMNGETYMASKLATTFRRALYKQHLGLAPPQSCTYEDAKSYPTPNMTPAPQPNVEELGTENDDLVADPLSDDLERLWKETATTNTDAFENVFHCVPSDRVQSWDEYKDYYPKKPVQTGHVQKTDLPLDYVHEQLARIKGHLVNMPLQFLSKEELLSGSKGAAVNAVTLDIYT